MRLRERGHPTVSVMEPLQSVNAPEAALPASLTVTKQYSTPLASASRVTSPAEAPFLRRKPSSALVGAPSLPKAD